MERFISLVFLLSLILLLVYLIRRDMRRLRGFHQAGIARLRVFVDENHGNGEAVFYRDSGGVWVETSQEDLEKQLKSTCKTQVNSKCTIFHEAKFCLDYDKERKAVLFVPGVNEYDFAKNNYYDEWAKGNKEFNDRVNKAMGRS